jgi:hypothetical protein
MATVDIILTTVQGRALTGATLQIEDSGIVASDVITSGASQAQSDFSVPASGDFVWVITVTGGAIRALFGVSPEASAGEGGGRLILAETVRQFAARNGEKISVINA